jgi:hypothetical protein
MRKIYQFSPFFKGSTCEAGEGFVISMKTRIYIFFLFININKITHKLIKISAKLKIEKYLIQIKSVTLQYKTLSIQFQIAQESINQKQVLIKTPFLFLFTFK